MCVHDGVWLTQQSLMGVPSDTTLGRSDALDRRNPYEQVGLKEQE